MNSQILHNYFLIIFSFIPVSFLIGPSISLSNIIFIDLSFILLLFYKKDFSFLKNETTKYLLILLLYLIFNSFISLNYEMGLERNIGFLRIIFLFGFINYFFLNIGKEKQLFDFWTIVLSILIIDIFIEFFFWL